MTEILTLAAGLISGPVAAFFGGGAFRLILGEVSAWWTKRQDHKHEIERMREQRLLDDAAHARTTSMLTLQHQFGLKMIEAQTQQKVESTEIDGWLETIKNTAIKVGVAWIDGWNAVMRPAIATWGIVMLTIQEAARLFGATFVLSDITLNVACGAIGIFIASRDLQKRGK